MGHSERKSFELPCGKTVAQTWAALRKSWLGFKIAKSNNDVARMKYYAEFIVKMQTELGVSVTRFGSDLVESQIGGDEEKAQTNGGELRDTESDDFSFDDLDLNYDDQILPSEPVAAVSSMPPPRNEILSTYFDRKEKSCPPSQKYLRNKSEPGRVKMRRIYYRKSCPSPSVPEYKRNLPEDIISRTVYSEKSEPYLPRKLDETKSMNEATRQPLNSITSYKNSQSYVSDFYLSKENHFGQNNDNKQRRLYPTDSSDDKVRHQRYHTSKLIEQNSCAWPATHSNQTKEVGKLLTDGKALYEPYKYGSDPSNLPGIDMNESENANRDYSMCENAKEEVISSDFYQHPTHRPVKRRTVRRHKRIRQNFCYYQSKS